MEDFFTRCDEWLTGIASLDAQHAGLADSIRKIENACNCTENTQSGDSLPGKQLLSALLDKLYQATKKHFEHEEAVMREAGYPDYAAHRREHIMMLAELKLIINMERESTSMEMDSGLARELKTWFIGHIRQSDCKFSAYASAHREAAELESAADVDFGH